MALPLDYRPGQHIQHPRVTTFELASPAGERWAEVQLPEQQHHVNIHVFDPTGTSHELPDGASATTPVVATLNGYGATETRLLRRSRARRTTLSGRSRLQVELTLDLRTQRRTTWLVPEPGAHADRVAIHTEAGLLCATLSFEAERRCVSLLDASGTPRVVLSIDPQPAWEGERFRGVIASSSGHETMLYLVVIDGSAPAGQTRELLMP
ncbi:MAG: hypothetical protein AB7P03_15390 [Kofleriaceae bacterium]